MTGRAWPRSVARLEGRRGRCVVPGRSAALEPEGAAEKEPSREGEEPLAMSSPDHGDPLAAAELDPAKAHQEEPPLRENADCSPGQLPPSPPKDACHPGSYCQAWLLAPLEDSRFLICCTNWY